MNPMTFFQTKSKKVCLLCEADCTKDYSVVKYRYEGGQIGEANLCAKCSEDINNSENGLGDVDEFSL